MSSSSQEPLSEKLTALRERFDQVWILDTEYQAPSGEAHTPVCMCSYELFSGRTERAFFDCDQECPLPIGDRILYVGFALSAEWATWIPLGWTLPTQAIDLRFEYLNLVNGVYVGGVSVRGKGTGLISAMQTYVLPTMSLDDKQAERANIIRNGVTPPVGVTLEEHKQRVFDYCDLDVIGTVMLFEAMLPELDLDQSIYRGQYSFAVGWFEFNGLPIDREMLGKISGCAPDLQLRIVEQVESEHEYGVYEIKTNKKTGVRTQHWRNKAFAALVERLGITNWPRTAAGNLSCDKDDFKDMCAAYPELEPLRQTKKSVRDLAKFRPTVGKDGRNRFAVMPFGGLSGRNQSKAKSFIMLQAKWARHLLKPGPGMALVQLDIIAAEAALAAAFSRDPEGLRIYQSGADQYLEFAKFAGAVPADATKESHKSERSLYKTSLLGINYGMGFKNLASRLKVHDYQAEKIIADHRKMFAVYWAWVDAQVARAVKRGYIETEYGWRYNIPRGKSPNTIKNFPQQAGCAELLRLVCILMVEAGLGPYMCAPLHDAVYLECPIEMAKEVSDAADECFRVAGDIITDSAVTLRTDQDTTCYPDRYESEDGEQIWKIVTKFVAEKEAEGYQFAEYDCTQDDLGYDDVDTADIEEESA
jgi:DNA polymerase-1